MTVQHILSVEASQWRMEIGNFNNIISNSLCDYVFCLSKSLMVIAYLLYAVLFKHIVHFIDHLANPVMNLRILCIT